MKSYHLPKKKAKSYYKRNYLVVKLQTKEQNEDDDLKKNSSSRKVHFLYLKGKKEASRGFMTILDK